MIEPRIVSRCDENDTVFIDMYQINTWNDITFHPKMQLVCGHVWLQRKQSQQSPSQSHDWWPEAIVLPTKWISSFISVSIQWFEWLKIDWVDINGGFWILTNAHECFDNKYSMPKSVCFTASVDYVREKCKQICSNTPDRQFTPLTPKQTAAKIFIRNKYLSNRLLKMCSSTR